MHFNAWAVSLLSVNVNTRSLFAHTSIAFDPDEASTSGETHETSTGQ